MINSRDLRFPKQFGDFAESLVMYLLGLNNLSVAQIDHVGADVIAVNELSGFKRFAISVKGRNFPDTESKSFDFDRANIEKLKKTATLFDMIPAVSFVFVDCQEGIKKIRIIMSELSVLEKFAKDKDIDFINYNKNQGIQVKFTCSNRVNHLRNIQESSQFFYSELTFNEMNVFF
ncbi:hypothetical protein HO929_00520 [Streptococcus suis]|nr:hypothetical protein [Streptococcus suis]